MDGRTLTPFALIAALVVAGPIGPAWAPRPSPEAVIANMQPVEPPAPPHNPARQVSAAELRCLALNVYWESRGQPLRGQAAVAHVTLNRTVSPDFPASICGVVHQGCQFGWTCDGKKDLPTTPAAWADSLEVAKRALAGEPDPTGGALYFHHVQERPQWAQGRYDNRITIGQHVFFNVKNGSERQLAQAAFDP
ncbi:MAG: cell wall hydrolase [Magnetospirillum sp.]|nr:cell wall hydrolase [Magnetospirillum sp.]